MRCGRAIFGNPARSAAGAVEQSFGLRYIRPFLGSSPCVDILWGSGMYAIVFKADGLPICRQLPGVSPDPVVTWNTEDAATAFIRAKGGEADFEPVQLTDEAMDKMAQSLGYPVESMTFDPYPA